MTRRAVSNRIAALYPIRPLRGYARWKIRFDPVYAGVLEHLRGRSRPVVDVGCGIGLLALFLRDAGFEAPITGIDFDERKIAIANAAATAANASGVKFEQGDVQNPLPEGHDVVMLDILQYFDKAGRRRVIEQAVRAVPRDGLVILRTGIRDTSWRYRFTWLVDYAGWLLFWMRADRVQFPTASEILAAFDGFDASATPLRGRLPYNNWLYVFRRKGPSPLTRPSATFSP